MAYLFRPPIVCDMPLILPDTTGIQYRLFRYFGDNCRGISVVKVNGEYVTVEYPSQDLLTGEEGVDWFQGGHLYIIPNDVAEELIDDGYGGGDDDEGTIVAGTTWGDHSDETWGSLYATFWEEM